MILTLTVEPIICIPVDGKSVEIYNTRELYLKDFIVEYFTMI